MREGGAPSPPTPESVLNVEAFSVPNLPGSHTPCPFSLAQVSSNTFLLPPPTPFRFLLGKLKNTRVPHLLQGLCVCPTRGAPQESYLSHLLTWGWISGFYLTIIQECNWVKIMAVPGQPQGEHHLI